MRAARRRRLAVMQSGGPTAVVNASLLGFVEAAWPGEIVGILGGPAGLLKPRFRRIRPVGEARGEDEALRVGSQAARRPGALLGAGRYPFSSEDLDTAAEVLLGSRIDGIALIGGNGTMYLADQLQRRLEAAGSTTAVVGVPKTVDNDLVGTDHSPGFPSSARFLLQAIRDLHLDHQAMSSIEQVRIVEVLGRRTGWLALASTLARRSSADPHLVYVPEVSFDETTFLKQVETTVMDRGRALVVVSEGVVHSDAPGRFDSMVYDRPMAGGVGQVLAESVRSNLDFGVRAEVLGLVQRCASWAVSRRDRFEAQELGAEAARLLLEGVGGKMVGLAEGSSVACSSTVTVNLGEVAGKTRPVPAKWLPGVSGQIDHSFADWLWPLVDPRHTTARPLSSRERT
jgi:6-phosphofructokinase